MNWEKFDPYQKLEDATTPQEMRRAIEHAQRYNPIIRNVLMVGRYDGLSAEDTYTMLAYYALQRMCESERLILKMAAEDTRIPMLVQKVDTPPSGEGY